MGEETPPNTVNLDLNLGPVVHPSQHDDEPGSINLEDWLEGPVREPVAPRTRARQRWRSVLGPLPGPVESRNVALELITKSVLETGEGSVAPKERLVQNCDTHATCSDHDSEEKEDSVVKNDKNEGSFFDCNICLDLATDPVVTCCGHLFCWPCLYRWLHIHSDTRECPICKGEVTLKNLTPIYGRGNPMREPDDDPVLKIPNRPQARRLETWRQTIQRSALTIPMEEMIRRLGSRFDLTHDLVQGVPNPLVADSGESREPLPERSSLLLNRFLTSRGMRVEQNMDVLAADLPLTSTMNTEIGETARHPITSLSQQRHPNRVGNVSGPTSALSSGERLVESYFPGSSLEEGNQGQFAAVDDRDSMSSIAAVIQSESQTVDNAVEIDSNFVLSTSSSRRRRESSRASDVDSGDSHAPRRRRLH